jgi:phospholipase D1/2
VALALALAWRFTGLSEIATPERVRDFLAGSRAQWWAPLFALGAYLVGAAVFFPVTILTLAIAATYGPLYGGLYALFGIIVSGAITYGIGRRWGQQAVSALLGERWLRVRGKLERRGVLAVVAVRVVPTLPFTFINMAIGASAIRPLDFVVGTLIGMGPTIAMICILGDRIVSLLLDPSLGQIALFAVCLAAWIGVSVAAQALVTRLTER